MQRRAFIAGSIGTVGALAGCATLGVGDDDDEESGDSDGDGKENDGSDVDFSTPTDPVESFVEGYAANDTDVTRASIHDDGPLAGDLSQSVEDRQLDLANASVVTEANGTATVEANVSVRGDADQWQESREFEVREREEEWRVWSMSTGPELTLQAYFSALEADRPDAALDHLHPESPNREWLDAAVVEAASLSLESASLAASSDDEATVEATFTEDVGEVTIDRSRRIELRRTDDGWRVWSLRFGPVVAISRYLGAVNENDPDAYAAMIHPESPVETDVSESNLQQLSMSEESIENVDGPEDGEATVEAALEVTIVVGGEEQTETTSTEFVLRTHEGEWLLYE